MSKAYEFIRKTFNLALPHQAQIRRWYSKVHAGPGFTGPAFDALHASVLAAREKGQEVVCSLMLDEMAIRKHTEWDGKNTEDSSILAMELTIMIHFPLPEMRLCLW